MNYPKWTIVTKFQGHENNMKNEKSVEIETADQCSHFWHEINRYTSKKSESLIVDRVNRVKQQYLWHLLIISFIVQWFQFIL